MYGFYVWTSYVIAAVLLGGISITSYRLYLNARKRLNIQEGREK